MTEKNMTLELTKWIEDIPQLQNQTFNFDYTEENPTSYAILLPTNIPNLTSDIVGNEKKQMNFYIRAVSPWGKDIMQNINNVEFFRLITKSVKELNKKKIFPDFGTDKIIEKIEMVTDGYLDSSDINSAIYQIQGRVLYTDTNTLKTGKLPDRW